MSRFSTPLALRPAVDVIVPTTAMVLAAGLGKRMRPLTATRPKPLVEVAGRSLLDRALDHLTAAGVARAVVNVHYFAEQVEAHLASRAAPDVVISDERGSLLETGGGVTKALPLIDCDPFYVINSDNLWVDGSIDTLKLLAQRWDSETMDALLLLVPLARASGYEGRGDFYMNPMGRLRRRVEHRVAPYVFSGVQLLSKRLFEGEPIEAFSLNRVYDKALANGRLFGAVHGGMWFHVGTPASVGETEVILADS
ncbi:nucleotidyltransferase family protein [Polymorphobacter sp. PAMC 29334]|uniref:nucleotidyltransferase family protein n=1 Tax=Polymorphobacter sp. PAMC 29334 TaxID=2862331 RepID=UPI001C672A98|nr:nucleotidyltransferase family protein [Polymorphobacter sp. PAMC 29334]QYE34952.1 nucleotidyltransferase family protein [Polymorphobacter sp. PAMC 29334]